MKIDFISQSDGDDGVLAVFAMAGAALTPGATRIDAATGGALTRALKTNRFTGALAETLDLVAPAGLAASRVVLVGLGAPGKAGAAEFERIGGELIAKLAISGETRLTVQLDGAGPLTISAQDAAARLAFGAQLRAYRFDRYRTKEAAAKKPSLGVLAVSSADPKAAQAEHAKLDPVAQGVFLTRDLLSEPPNVLTPKAFTERARELTGLGVKVEALGEAEMLKLGFGALLGVSQGSALEPQLLLVEYDGTGRAGDPAAPPPVVFLGKGVTFDAGGISIKPAAGMETMKWDMGGAGAILGAIKTLALRKAKCRVVGVCAMVENMPSGTAQRPGDVVTSYSGQTVEILDTDCEGRLVLADAVWYAQERYQPKVIIDLATLTGAVVITLANEYAGLFANDDTLAAQLLDLGQATGDRLWRLPLGEAYDRKLDSTIADMKNVATSQGSSVIAAQFIGRFIKDGVAWAHLDISGTAWADEDRPLCEKGATGYGVRLLDRYMAEHHEPA